MVSIVAGKASLLVDASYGEHPQRRDTRGLMRSRINLPVISPNQRILALRVDTNLKQRTRRRASKRR